VVPGRQFLKETMGFALNDKKEKKQRTLILFNGAHRVERYAAIVVLLLTWRCLDALLISKSVRKDEITVKSLLKFHPSTNVHSFCAYRMDGLLITQHSIRLLLTGKEPSRLLRFRRTKNSRLISLTQPIPLDPTPPRSSSSPFFIKILLYVFCV